MTSSLRSTGLRAIFATIGALLCTMLLSSAVQANELVIATVDQYLKTQTRGLPGKVSISVGQLDPRTQLSPCNAMEPFTPAGTRLWGKGTVGVRCLGPATWTVYVPVQVNISGSYVVAAHALSPGQPLTGTDLILRQGDLTTLPASVLTDPAQGVGKTVKNPIGSGQPVRGDMLVAPFVVQQGQSVRMIAKGAGYAVSNEGKALNNASEGQVVQARTSGGQVVSGIARPGGIIEISP